MKREYCLDIDAQPSFFSVDNLLTLLSGEAVKAYAAALFRDALL